jgi:hypothetical protein
MTKALEEHAHNWDLRNEDFQDNDEASRVSCTPRYCDRCASPTLVVSVIPVPLLLADGRVLLPLCPVHPRRGDVGLVGASDVRHRRDHPISAPTRANEQMCVNSANSTPG